MLVAREFVLGVEVEDMLGEACFVVAPFPEEAVVWDACQAVR